MKSTVGGSPSFYSETYNLACESTNHTRSTVENDRKQFDESNGRKREMTTNGLFFWKPVITQKMTALWQDKRGDISFHCIFFFLELEKKTWLADSSESWWLLLCSLLDGPPQWMDVESPWSKTKRFRLSFFVNLRPCFSLPTVVFTFSESSFSLFVSASHQQSSVSFLACLFNVVPATFP